MKFTAGWGITSLCNLQCLHCYIGNKERSWGLKLEDLLKIADKLKEFGVSSINFGGGEPPLRGDLKILSNYLKNSLEMRLSLTTNGTTYHLYKNYVDVFDEISVSLDFPDKERHNNFRSNGRINVFDKL